MESIIKIFEKLNNLMNYIIKTWYMLLRQYKHFVVCWFNL